MLLSFRLPQNLFQKKINSQWLPNGSGLNIANERCGNFGQEDEMPQLPAEPGYKLIMPGVNLIKIRENKPSVAKQTEDFCIVPQ